MISNSSPLIIFGKINRLDLLFKVYKKIEIVPAVFEEVVVQGEKINAPEALLINNFAEKKLITIKALDLHWQKKSVRTLKKKHGPNASAHLPWEAEYQPRIPEVWHFC